MALVVGVLAAAVAAQPAMAAPRTGLHVSDPAGDANGINDQGLGEPVPSVPSVSTSPASVSGADITKIDLVTDFIRKGKARKASGFDVVLKLAGPVQKGTIVTVTM